MCLVRGLLNDSSIDTNMNINYAEMILKHVLDKHEGAAEAVNTLYEEIAERINAEGPKRAREVCEAVIIGGPGSMSRAPAQPPLYPQEVPWTTCQPVLPEATYSQPLLCWP